MPEIKERPIPFGGPMIRAILDGRKTVTRREITRPPVDGWAFDGEYGRITSPHPKRGRFGAFIRRGVGTDFPELDIVPCPYGMPGDRLWVRETWQGPLVSCDEQEADPSWFKDMKRYQNPSHCVYHASGDSCEHFDPDDNYCCNWRPSIHMPRWASRILLEVTDARVERLQDITYEQAVAEGVYRTTPRVWTATDEGGACHKYPEHAFRDLWISTGGDWDANPWVWCIEFKRIQP